MREPGLSVVGVLERKFRRFTRYRMRYSKRWECGGDEAWIIGRAIRDEWRCKGEDLLWAEGNLESSAPWIGLASG